MWYKRICFWMLCVILCMNVAGCGKQIEKTNEKDVVYKSESIVPDVAINGIVTSFAVWNNKIYVYASPWQTADYDQEGNAVSKEKSSTGKWYSMNFDGTATEELSMPATEGMIENMYLASSKSAIWLLLFSQNEGKYIYTVIQADESGNVKTKLDITTALELDDDDQVEKMLIGNSGKPVVVTDKKIVMLDADGNKLGEAIPDAGYVQSVAFSKNGDVLSADVSDNGITISAMNQKTFQWEKYQKIEGDATLSNNVLMDGAAYDFYYRDNLGIYGYDENSKKIKKVLDYAASNIYTENTGSICPIDEKRMLGIADARTSDGAKLILYTKVEPENVEDKQVVTYGAIQLDTNMKNAIAEFNRSNSQYYIQIKEYYKESEPETKLALDLVSDNAPDIIDISGQSVEKYIEKSVLEDLTSYFEKDDDVGIDKMIPSVAEAIKTDGEYYYVTPGFRIAALAGKASVVGEAAQWNIDDVMQMMKKYPDAQLLYNNRQLDLLNLFLAQGTSSFVNWKEGKCSFDQERFRNLLEFCAQGGSDGEEYEIGKETEYIQKNKVLLTPVTIGAEDLQVYQAMYGEKIAYKGYPSDENGGTSFVFPVQIAMSANSQNKEGAWAFLRMLMTKEYQAKHISVESADVVVVPTRQDVFELYQKVRMTTEAYTDDSNTTVLPMSMTVSYDGQEVQLKPMSTEEMQEFIDLVDHTMRVTEHEYEIQQIVEEEAEAYFTGRQTLDKTIEVMQDRATKYVNENR